MLKKRMDIEKQLYLFQIFGIVVTAALCLVLMISVTLSRNNRQQEEELLEECTTLTRAKNVVESLETGVGDEYLSNYLNIYIKSIANLDFVAVCDTENTCLYYPNRAFIKYTFNNVGNTFSAKSIADYLKAERRSLDNETVYSYLEKLEKAYLLHRCSRYDLQGKEILKTQEKFYLADVALRYSVLGYNADSVASSLENIVYLELCRRGYTVNVGKTGDSEIDFVAVRQNEKIYVQVTQEINSEKTEKREYSRLLEIPDNYPKFVLTTDEFAGGNYEGIKTMHIADFLLSAEY